MLKPIIQEVDVAKISPDKEDYNAPGINENTIVMVTLVESEGITIVPDNLVQVPALITKTA